MMLEQFDPQEWIEEATRYYRDAFELDDETAEGDSATDGRGDAFRHVFSSALMSVYTGTGISRFIWDEHELLSPNPPLSHRMDLWNNEVGYQLGMKYADEIAEYLNNGAVLIPDSFFDTLKNRLANDVKMLMDLPESPVIQHPEDSRLQELFKNDPKLLEGTWGLIALELAAIDDDIQRIFSNLDIIGMLTEVGQNQDDNDDQGTDPNNNGRGDGIGEGDGHGGADITPPPHRDPIFIDLNRNGKIDASKETYFDLNNNGFMEKTAWMSDGDGILVADRNGDGVINDGTEVFGDGTFLEDGTLANNGFEALAEFDDNADGIINAADVAYESLKVWVDANCDGISTEDELVTHLSQ